MNTPYWFSNLAYWSAQVALLVLAAGLLPHLFKIRQPRVLLIYWRALVVISLLLPFAQPWHHTEIFSSVTFAPRIGEFSPMVITRANPAATHWHLPSGSTMAEIIGLIILAGIAARFTILSLGLLKLRQFRQASWPVSNHAESTSVLDEMRVRVNTGGEFRISSDVDSPVTFGLSAPVILLPERFPSFDARHQAAIACHELLHVRRRDWAHHLCEEILRAALWFHPAIAWLIARIRLSREQVVDLEVLRLTNARKPYLEALLEFTDSRALATSIPAPPFLVERQLAERVALMLKEVRMSRARLIASLTAIAACLAVVATIAVWTFPLKAAPSSRQEPPRNGIAQGISGGISAGIAQGISGGIKNGKIDGVPDGITGGVRSGINSSGPSRGVDDGINGGISGDMRKLPLISGNVHRKQNSGEKVYHAGENGISMPVCEYCPRPEYSEEARQAKIAGTVYLQVTVLATGRIGEIKVTKGLEESLDKSAIETIRNKWTFKPAIGPNGDPVDTIVPVMIAFQFLDEPRSAATASQSRPILGLVPSEGMEVKIFTAPVSGSGESTPYYMGRVKPQILAAPNPPFPRLAKQRNLSEGLVTLNIIVDTQGKVISAQIVKSSDPIFEKPALETARKWRMIGRTRDGAPVTFQIPVEMSFRSN